MKKTIVGALMLLVSASAVAQSEIFKKYGDEKGVTSVYISKSMFDMISSAKFNFGNMELGKIMGKIDSMNVLECERKSLSPKIWKEVNDYCEANNYELIMKVSDSGEKSNIYLKQQPKKKNILILLTNDGDELNVVNIVGSVSVNDIKRIMR